MEEKQCCMMLFQPNMKVIIELSLPLMMKKKGIVDFSEYLLKGGVFDRFKDIDFFKNFSVNDELGTLTWRNDIDVAPEKLYSKATGNPLPKWMEL